MVDDKTTLLEAAQNISVTPSSPTRDLPRDLPRDHPRASDRSPQGSMSEEVQGTPVVSQTPGQPPSPEGGYIDEDFPGEAVQGVTVVEGADASQVRGATDRLVAMFTPR